MSKIEIGDKVRFLNDVGEGIVLKILAKNNAIVEDEDGFEYTHPMNELVLIEKSVRKIHANNPKTSENPSSITQVNSEPHLKKDGITKIYLAFIYKNGGNEDGFDTYLVNDSDFYVNYNLVISKNENFQLLDADFIEPNTKIFLKHIEREKINSSQKITIQMLLHSNQRHLLHPMFEKSLKIIPADFFMINNFVNNNIFDDKAYLIELINEDNNIDKRVISKLEKVLGDKDVASEDLSKRFKSRQAPKQEEVDLHVNQLVDSVVGLSNAEILDIQMKVFHQTITDAIYNKVDRVVLIHGIGNGTLKAALRESLEKHYHFNFEDASFKEYGFGATLVFVK